MEDTNVKRVGLPRSSAATKPHRDYGRHSPRSQGSTGPSAPIPEAATPAKARDQRWNEGHPSLVRSKSRLSWLWRLSAFRPIRKARSRQATPGFRQAWRTQWARPRP